MTDKLQIIFRKTSQLLPYAKNSRDHSDEQVSQIAESIKTFGFNDPVEIDKNGEIVAGHGRVLAAKKLGMKEIPTIELAHLDEKKKKAYNIANNKIAQNSTWDELALKDELELLNENNFDLTITGFTEDEIDEILNHSEKLREVDEEIQAIKKTRILISIPTDIIPDGIEELLEKLKLNGAEIDFSGN